MIRIDDIEASVSENRCVVPGYYLLTIALSKPMPNVLPGQFIMLKVPSTDIFLRRPFSIYDYRRGKLSVLYKVAGRGTAELATAAAGDKIMALGPLGNGFTLLKDHQAVLVAGGIGFAGLHMLWSTIRREKPLLFFGCSNSAEASLLHGLVSCDPHISTLDGSTGCKGNVIDMLAGHISSIPKRFQIFACGPEPMYLSLKKLLERERTACQVLVEERMACGLGLCFGCVRKTTDDSEPYKRVCKEGPVFDIWQISL